MSDTTTAIQCCIIQGELPATNDLRTWAGELGVTIDLPLKYPTKVQKQAAWVLIQAAVPAAAAPIEPEPAPPLQVKFQVVKSGAGDDVLIGCGDTKAEAEAIIEAVPPDSVGDACLWIRKVWTNA